MLTMIMKDRRKQVRRLLPQTGADTPPRKHLPSVLYSLKSWLFIGMLLTMLLHLFPVQSISAAETKQNQITQPGGTKTEQETVNRDLAQLSVKINELFLNKLTMLRELRRLSRLQSITAPLENFSQLKTRFEETLQDLKADPDRSRRQLIQLQIELRAFVPDIDDRMRTLSELNRDINTALDEAGITIPFPQNDLHLKTIAPELQAVMSKRQDQDGSR